MSTNFSKLDGFESINIHDPNHLPAILYNALREGGFSLAGAHRSSLLAAPAVQSLQMDVSFGTKSLVIEQQGDYYRIHPVGPVAPNLNNQLSFQLPPAGSAADQQKRRTSTFLTFSTQNSTPSLFPDEGPDHLRILDPSANPASWFAPTLAQSSSQSFWDGMLQGKTRLILFFHGNGSSVENSFQDVNWKLLNPNFLYIGFDHETYFRAPDQNANNFFSALNSFWASIATLANPIDTRFICYSRGALVGRCFAKLTDTAIPKMQFNKIITFGSPNEGTSIVSSAVDLLNLLLNAGLKYLVTPFASGVLSNLLVALAEDKILAGSASMLPGGPFLTNLGPLQNLNHPPQNNNIFTVDGTYTPDTWWQGCLDFIWTHAVFQGHPNDLVIDTPYMVLPPSINTALNNCNHFQYFQQAAQLATDPFWTTINN